MEEKQFILVTSESPFEIQKGETSKLPFIC